MIINISQNAITTLMKENGKTKVYNYNSVAKDESWNFIFLTKNNLTYKVSIRRLSSVFQLNLNMKVLKKHGYLIEFRNQSNDNNARFDENIGPTICDILINFIKNSDLNAFLILQVSWTKTNRLTGYDCLKCGIIDVMNSTTTF